MQPISITQIFLFQYFNIDENLSPIYLTSNRIAIVKAIVASSKQVLFIFLVDLCSIKTFISLYRNARNII